MHTPKRRLYKKPVKILRRQAYRLANYLVYPFSPTRGRIVNEKEIRIIGLQRSGNHPIINWLFHQSVEVKCFLNFVEKNANPFLAFQKRGTVTEFQADFFEKFNIFAERLGLFSRKQMLLYSYEDEHLWECFSAYFEKNHDRWLGRSGKRFDVMILRDPYNLFSSRLKKEDFRVNRYSLQVPEERAIIVELWKAYAREFLGETNYLKNNKTVINYNRWFEEEKYRQELAERLELTYSDSTIKEVLPIGGGSSFDRTSFNDSASEMKVLERWKYFADNDDFKNIFKDEELVALSERIFGRIPGTEKLIT